MHLIVQMILYIHFASRLRTEANLKDTLDLASAESQSDNFDIAQHVIRFYLSHLELHMGDNHGSLFFALVSHYFRRPDSSIIILFQRFVILSY